MRRILSVIACVAAFAGAALAASVPASAAGDITTTSYTVPIDTFQLTENRYREGEKNVVAFIKRVVGILLVAISTLAALFIVVGGVMLVTSGGETSKATAAKSVIQYNIIAIAMALFSYSIMQFVTWVLTNGAS